MDIEDIKLSVKRVFTDRSFLGVMAMVAMAGIVYLLLIGFNIHSSDVTVYTRYTAFGEAHFYKSHWLYLFNFLVFGLVVTLVHLALMVKFHNMDRRQTAVFVGWTGIIVLVIAATYAMSVMHLGRIS